VACAVISTEKSGLVDPDIHDRRVIVRLFIGRQPTQAVHHPGDLHHGLPHDGDIERKNHFQRP
jgi:hypothetical protein